VRGKPLPSPFHPRRPSPSSPTTSFTPADHFSAGSAPLSELGIGEGTWRRSPAEAGGLGASRPPRQEPPVARGSQLLHRDARGMHSIAVELPPLRDMILPHMSFLQMHICSIVGDSLSSNGMFPILLFLTEMFLDILLQLNKLSQQLLLLGNFH
jgi:hypothetical protein